MPRVLILAGVSALVFLGGCGDLTPPEDTVRSFLEAVRAGDDDGIVRCLVEKEQGPMYHALGIRFPDGGYRLGETTIDGDTARVAVAITVGGRTTELDMILAREDEGWRINLDDSLGFRGLETDHQD